MNHLKVYMVGGAVRDKLLGLDPKDIDYVVVGSTIEEMVSLGFTQVGADFPVFLHPHTGEEYALARQEKKTGPGYHGFEAMFSPDVTLEQDLARRDLTINAMAMLPDGTVVDPYGGQADLRDKILRRTTDAFLEDPVRILRLARFYARYEDFSIAADTLNMCAEMIRDGELDNVTPERIWAEFKKGLMERRPDRMFRVLNGVHADRVLKEFFVGYSKSMNALQMAAEHEASLEVRFTTIGSGFKMKEDYAKWTIPSDCQEVSMVVNNNLQSFVNYEKLTSTERVQFFQRCDAIRRIERFNQIMTAASFIMSSNSGEEWPPEIFNTIRADAGKIYRVPAGGIAQQCTDKSKIAETIFNARVKALDEEE
jgi:tRNA nucleotidyltransferase (CCA-adding enzyme)